MGLEWNGFKLEEFTFSERLARVVYPNGNFNGKIMVKTEYWDAFPNFEIEMVKRGYALINIEHQTRWASDNETEIMADFIRFMQEKLEADEKCILVGMSCGGLQAARLAQMYPEMVSAIYLDAPVLNILSMAGLGDCECSDEFWRELVCTYGFSKSTVINFRNSPIDHMQVLMDNDIPIIMLYGNNDSVVVYTENGKVLEDFYKKKGGRIKVICKTMCGHHPHGLSDPTPIIEFIEEYGR